MLTGPRRWSPLVEPGDGHDDVASGRSDPGRDGDGHHRRRGEAPQRLRARHQPAGEIHREVARHPLLPAPERPLSFRPPKPQSIFEQINAVYKKVDDLTEIISRIGRGGLSELRIGSVPSISQVMVPRADRARAPPLPRPAHRHQHPQARGGHRLSAARQRRLRRHELPARPSRPRLPAAGLGRIVLHRAGGPRTRRAQADRRRGNDPLSADRDRSQ